MPPFCHSGLSCSKVGKRNPLDKSLSIGYCNIGFPNTYLLNSYLSIGQDYQMFEQLGPSKYLSDTHVFTFNEETELIPSNSIRPHLDIQRVLRLVKEVPRSLINQINQQ